MGINAFDLVQIVGMRQQVLMNPEFDFTTYLELRKQEHVQRVADNSLSRIFHCNHATLCITRLHLIEYDVDSWVAQRMD